MAVDRGSRFATGALMVEQKALVHALIEAGADAEPALMGRHAVSIWGVLAVISEPNRGKTLVVGEKATFMRKGEARFVEPFARRAGGRRVTFMGGVESRFGTTIGA